MSFRLAVKSFFKIISNKEFSEKVKRLDDSSVIQDTKVIEPIQKEPSRSDAITLLSALQRDARLIDFLKEDISGYEDEQIGSAVRDIHQKSGKVLEKFFKIQPLSSEDEGASVSVPMDFDQAKYSLTGAVQGEGPFNGQLEHGGWQVSRVELPIWNGTNEAKNIIAPIEVEVK